MKFKGHIILGFLLLFAPYTLLNSQVLVESVVATVGQNMVLLSELEDRVFQQQISGDKRPYDEIRCEILEQMLIAKLFVDQARIDSIIVNTSYVDSDANMRINDAIRSAGSEKALEEFFRKDMIEIRNDIREALVEQETISQVQSTIVQDITATPNDVKRFFASIPKDSLPIIPGKVQVSIIQLDNPGLEESKMEARQQLLEIRNKILDGQSFSMLAVFYSEDTGTATKGGELGYLLKGELQKEYADAAFSLAPGAISRIIETRFGYHIIQMIDKKGDMANTRHILIKPKVNPEQQLKAIAKLDSLAQAIRRDSISFENAARQFSTHKDSRINGGKYVSTNPSDRIIWLQLEDFDSDMYLNIRKLKIGEISDPFATTDEDGNTVFRIVRLDDEMPAHRANVKDDYQIMYSGTINKKQSELYNEWIKEKINTTYIKISEECESCDFLKDGWIK